MRPEQLDQMVAAMDQAAARFTHRPAIHDLEHTLTEIVAGAVAAVPGATHAGMTLRQRDGRLTSTAPTTELVARLDQAQSALGEGPCVLAAGTDHDGDDVSADDQDEAPVPAHALVVRIDDMPAEAVDGGRWPRFGPEAVRNDINSMMSIQLVGDQAQVTALNLYAQHPHTFDDSAETVARLFADQAAIALYGARHAAGLNDAVTSRDIIGQAKGILTERHRISGPDAFAMLVRTSQDTNIKLVEVAEWLVADTSPENGTSPALNDATDATHHQDTHRQVRPGGNGPEDPESGEPSVSNPREPQVLDTFLALTDTLVSDYDPLDMLSVLAERSVELLEVSAAGIILTDGNGGGLSVAAASSERARLLEVFAVAVEHGPCTECLKAGAPVVAADLTDTDRWPQFSAGAAEAGFRAVHAVPMRLHGHSVGVLTLLHTEPLRLDGPDARLAQALADAATVGLLNDRAVRRAESVADQLQKALNTRVLIEQAKGILAARTDTTPDDAFTVLRGHARTHGLTLGKLSRDVIEGSVDLTTILRPDR